MSVTIECPQCHKRYTVDEAASGKTAVCQACGARMQIPDLGQAARPPEPEPKPQPEPQPQEPGELPRQMMANRAVAGHTCPICKQEIALGQPVRNCELCGQTHHDECWKKSKGCGTPDCGNAPLPELGFAPGEFEAPTGSEAPPGTKPCPHCGEPIAQAAVKCRHCQEYMPGHQAPGTTRQRTSGLAIGSLVCGILSLMVVCCGISIVLGPVAIVLGIMGRREIARSSGMVSGDGMALSGLILGAVSTALAAIFILIRILTIVAAASS